jgi:hypothetical protein
MGLLIDISSRHNSMATDYTDAYFAITDFEIRTIESGEFKVSYEFSAYPSRELKILSTSHTGIPLLDWGVVPIEPFYDAKIMQYHGEANLIDIFPTSIPSTSDSIKAGCYEHFKNYLDSKNVSYKDVFEETE